MQKKLVGKPVEIDPQYEVTYRELMQEKLEEEWAKLNPAAREFAEMCNNISWILTERI